MKLCILIIASLGESYERYLRAWKSIQYPSWVSIRYVFHSPELSSRLDVSGSYIYVRGQEIIKPGLFFKTRAAMEYLLANEEFDYILRSNLTSFFNIELLEKFLQGKPTENAMFGHYMFNEFLSGSGYIMTRDVAQRFIDWKWEEEINPMILHDDQNVGIFMHLHSIPHYDWNMEIAYPGISIDYIQIRCSPNALPENAPDMFEEVVSRYNKKINSGLVFYIAHYRSDAYAIGLLNYCVKGIQLYYPGSEIIICESESAVSREGYDISGATWVNNPLQNSSCAGCFKDYLVRCESTRKKGVFLHDSMILKGRFDALRLSRPFGFIWHFSQYHDVKSVEHPLIKEDLHKFLASHSMDCEDYVGCFGYALYGSYDSIERLWKTVPFEKYLALKEKRMALMDLERVVGAAAFQLGLVSSIDDCSLCGDIMKFPGAFHSKYNGESYEEIAAFDYKEACVKFWGRRLTLL